jgi:hypothetical protein
VITFFRNGILFSVILSTFHDAKTLLGVRNEIRNLGRVQFCSGPTPIGLIWYIYSDGTDNSEKIAQEDSEVHL